MNFSIKSNKNKRNPPSFDPFSSRNLPPIVKSQSPKSYFVLSIDGQIAKQMQPLEKPRYHDSSFVCHNKEEEMNQYFARYAKEEKRPLSPLKKEFKKSTYIDVRGRRILMSSDIFKPSMHHIPWIVGDFDKEPEPKAILSMKTKKISGPANRMNPVPEETKKSPVEIFKKKVRGIIFQKRIALALEKATIFKSNPFARLRLPENVKDSMNRTIEMTNNSISQVIWVDSPSSYTKNEECMTLLESSGLVMTFIEELQQLNNSIHNSICVVTIDSVDNVLRFLEHSETEFSKIFGVVVYYPRGRHFLHLLKRRHVLGVFDNPESILLFVLGFSRFYNKLQNNDQIPSLFGITFETYIMHFVDQKLEEQTSEPFSFLHSFIEKTFSLESKPKPLIEIFRQADSFLKGATRAPEALIKVCTEESLFFKIFNGILRAQNTEAYPYTMGITKSLQSFFESREEAGKPLFMGEVYRKVSLTQKQVEQISSYLGKETYLYFPGFFSATCDRNLVNSLPGNILMIIKVEPDFIYQSLAMFSEKTNPKSPKRIAQFSSFPKTEEIMFPVFYPFKVTSIKNLSNFYEVYITSPHLFYYNETNMRLLYSLQSNKKLDDKEMLQEFYEKKLIVDPLITRLPLYIDRAEVTFEIDFTALVKMNYERHLKNLEPVDEYLNNNEIAVRARNYRKESNEHILDFPSLLAIINFSRLEKLVEFFDYLILMITCTELPSTGVGKGQPMYRIIVGKTGGVVLSCSASFTEIDTTTNYQSYSSFFSTLVSVKEIYFIFACCDLKYKESYPKLKKFSALIRCIPSYDVLMLDLSFNIFGMKLLLFMMSKNEGLQTLGTLYLKMDGCHISDNELLTLTCFSSLSSLKKVSLSLEKNRLTASCLPALLSYTNCQELQEIELCLGGNKFEPISMAQLKFSFREFKANIHEEVVYF